METTKVTGMGDEPIYGGRGRGFASKIEWTLIGRYFVSQQTSG
jgi:hypothetical protein